MCFCILKNDHLCRFMGFGLTRQQQKLVDVLKKNTVRFVMKNEIQQSCLQHNFRTNRKDRA